jgi:alpha-L-fucosidase 2
MSRSCVIPNFLTLHNDWRGMGIGVDMDRAPVQLDANMGWTAAIQEMLLFSLPGKLRLLPALPTRWRQGTVGPLLARGSIEVTLSWDQDDGYVRMELLSRQREQEVELSLRDNENVVVSLKPNVPYSQTIHF